MKRHELSTNQKRVLPIFLKPGITQNLCKEAGIDRDTYYKWIKDPAWVEAFEYHTKLAAEEARNYLKALYSKAAQKIDKLLDSESEAIVLKAACAVLEYQFKYAEQDAIIKRVDQVMERLKDVENLKSNNGQSASGRGKAPPDG